MMNFGIAGVNGGGKDLIAEILQEEGFFVASATDMLAKGLREKGWPIDREHKAKLSTEWRKKYGMGAVVDKGLELYEPVKDEYEGFAVGSLRHPGEADRIHQLPNGLVIWVHADPEVAYSRIAGANRGADKAAEDQVTYEEFLAQQQREMQHLSGDTATLNIAGVKERADIFLENNGNDKEAFREYLLGKLGLSS